MMGGELNLGTFHKSAAKQQISNGGGPQGDIQMTLNYKKRGA